MNKVEQTLYIPLASRAWASEAVPEIMSDPDALRICKELGIILRVPRKTQVLLSLRAALIDRLAAGHLGKHPHTRVLQVGCGLDSRYRRISGYSHWYDLDFSEIMDVRTRFYPDQDGYTQIAGSLADHPWREQLKSGTPLLVIAEGVLMYLSEDEVKSFFQTLQDHYPGSIVMGDVFSTRCAAMVSRHTSLARTGAGVCWGIDDLRDICFWGSGMVLKGEYPFTGMPEVELLPHGWRLSLRAAGRIKAVRQAHRVGIVEV